jgi:DNA primase
LFPVRDFEGRLYGYTGRGIGDSVVPKVRDYAGLQKRHLILGENRWRRETERPTLIVEGLFGLAHLIEIGAEEHFNVGALMGSLMTPKKAERIVNASGPIYLLFDNDEAGYVGMYGPRFIGGEHDESRSAIHMLRHQRPLHVCPWPEGKDDPDQLTIEEVTGFLNLLTWMEDLP